MISQQWTTTSTAWMQPGLPPIWTGRYPSPRFVADAPAQGAEKGHGVLGDCLYQQSERHTCPTNFEHLHVKEIGRHRASTAPTINNQQSTINNSKFKSIMELTIENPSVAAAVNQEELCNSIIANLKAPELSPLERYAIAVMLKNAADAAAKILSNDGLNYALRKSTPDDPNECYEKASAGKQFTHRGFVYAVTFKPEYNYAQPDEHGREWVKTCKEIEELSKKSKAKNEYKKGLQSMILLEHPQLKPNDPIPTELSFKPKAKCDETA